MEPGGPGRFTNVGSQPVYLDKTDRIELHKLPGGTTPAARRVFIPRSPFPPSMGGRVFFPRFIHATSQQMSVLSAGVYRPSSNLKIPNLRLGSRHRPHNSAEQLTKRRTWKSIHAQFPGSLGRKPRKRELLRSGRMLELADHLLEFVGQSR